MHFPLNSAAFPTRLSAQELGGKVEERKELLEAVNEPQVCISGSVDTPSMEGTVGREKLTIVSLKCQALPCIK